MKPGETVVLMFVGLTLGLCLGLTLTVHDFKKEVETQCHIEQKP